MARRPGGSYSKAPTSYADFGNNSRKSGCIIVKHKGTVGRRLMFTALMGVPIAPGSKYDLVDSMGYHVEKPALKGKELEKLQAQGVRVIVLEKKYTQENLDSARKACREGQAPAPNVTKQ